MRTEHYKLNGEIIMPCCGKPESECRCEIGERWAANHLANCKVSPKPDEQKLREQEIRGRVLLEMVGACSFVDDCEKHCNPSDQESCYGVATDNVLILLIKEVG